MIVWVVSLYFSSHYVYVFSKSSTETMHCFYNQGEKLWFKRGKKTAPIWGTAGDTRREKENRHIPRAWGERLPKVTMTWIRLLRVTLLTRVKNKTACAVVSQISVNTKYQWRQEDQDSSRTLTHPREQWKWSSVLWGQSGCIWQSCHPRAPPPGPSSCDLSGKWAQGHRRGHTTALFAI